MHPRENLGILLRVLVPALLLVFSTTGAQCSFFNSGSGFKSATEDRDPIQYTSKNLVAGCSPIPDNAHSGATQPATWTKVAYDGTTSDAPILWPKGTNGVPYNIQVYIDPTDSGNVITADEAALTAWNAQLLGYAPGFLSVQYTYTTDGNQSSSSQVRAFDTRSLSGFCA